MPGRPGTLLDAARIAPIRDVLFDWQCLPVQANYGAMLDAFATVGSSTNKNVRSAWASFLVNASLLLTTEKQAESDGVLIATSAVGELLDKSPKDDSETMFRHGPIPDQADTCHSVGNLQWLVSPILREAGSASIPACMTCSYVWMHGSHGARVSRWIGDWPVAQARKRRDDEFMRMSMFNKHF